MMRCMTFNLRFQNDRDGENAWDFRKELVVQVIGKYRPTLLGTQEGTREQLLYLEERLPQYHMHSPGRVWDDTCQYPTLFYLSEHWSMKEGEEVWLSKTPSVHRSKDWDSAFPRMMSTALLTGRAQGEELWVIVTHLDHISANARIGQGSLIAEWISGRGGAGILMGDFNDFPSSPVHQVLVSPATGLRDTWQVLGRPEDEASMTHHEFSGIPGKCRMDWILVTRDFRIIEGTIARDNIGGRYPSDHFPYVVDFDWA
jgi:endonuclease/exonuclease/phosphatase family metal-dependent hydrolase